VYGDEGRVRIDFKTKGLKKARNIMLALGKMGAAYRAIEMHGKQRQGEGERGTNADVKDYLAEGGRDLGPNEDDAHKAAVAYVAQAEKFLRLQQDVKKPPSAQAANQASAKAFTNAARVVQRILADRVDKSEDQDGTAEKVTAPYAKARAAEYGIPDDQSQVFKASGQLLANLQGTGGLKLKKK
jgi:hypothetical protein